jgi:hypothetical protein
MSPGGARPLAIRGSFSCQQRMILVSGVALPNGQPTRSLMCDVSQPFDFSDMRLRLPWSCEHQAAPGPERFAG